MPPLFVVRILVGEGAGLPKQLSVAQVTRFCLQRTVSVYRGPASLRCTPSPVQSQHLSTGKGMAVQSCGSLPGPA